MKLIKFWSKGIKAYFSKSLSSYFMIVNLVSSSKSNCASFTLDIDMEWFGRPDEGARFGICLWISVIWTELR